MTPIRYRLRPDGPWLRWNNGGVDAEMLAKKQGEQRAFVNGLMVQALAFANGRVWSAEFGFKTREEYDAKEAT